MLLFRIAILDLLHICVVFFVRFLPNHSVLLINLGVLCEEKDLCMIILSMGYKMLCIQSCFLYIYRI